MCIRDSETTVPPGHTAPAVQAVESYGQMLPEAGAPCGQDTTQVRPLTKVPSGHELTQVPLVINGLASGHDATHVAPSVKVPSGHELTHVSLTRSVSLSSGHDPTHVAPSAKVPLGHDATQVLTVYVPAGHASGAGVAGTQIPSPRSASPTGQPAEHGAAMYALHFPADSAAKSSEPGPRCTCSVYCCWGFFEARTEFSRLGTRRASAATAPCGGGAATGAE